MYLYGTSGYAKVIIDILGANHEPIEALFDDNGKRLSKYIFYSSFSLLTFATKK